MGKGEREKFKDGGRAGCGGGLRTRGLRGIIIYRLQLLFILDLFQV